MALLDNGEVYSWGRNDEGQLGYEIKEEPKPAESKISEVPMVAAAPIPPQKPQVVPSAAPAVTSTTVPPTIAPPVAIPPTTIVPAAPVAAPVAVAVPSVSSVPKEENKAEAMKIQPAVSVIAKPPETVVTAKTPEELIAQLGDQNAAPKNCCPTPKKVESLSAIAKIVAGTNFTYALANDKSLFSWY